MRFLIIKVYIRTLKYFITFLKRGYLNQTIIASTTDHILKYWEPSIKTMIQIRKKKFGYQSGRNNNTKLMLYFSLMWLDDFQIFYQPFVNSLKSGANFNASFISNRYNSSGPGR